MKKIIYISGSRAEYGIMKELLVKLKNDSEIELVIAVTGMHCEVAYGETYKVIQQDGFKIEKFFPISINTENNSSILTSMSICQKKFGEYFEEKKFDAVMLLGDRYEIFSVAIAAAMHNLPIIHFHGGEKTLGNYDEFIRHSITKMSRLHLASTEIYRKRIIQLGENPDYVYNIGALGAQNSLLMGLPEKSELEARFGRLDVPYFMVVYHPETLSSLSIEFQLDELLSALEVFISDYNFIFIGSNSDTGADCVREKTLQFCQRNNSRYLISVKVDEYLALNKYSKGLIGNSSSGLIEIPSLKIPTINIGDRQKGRVRGASVIDIACKKEEIVRAIELTKKEQFIELVNNSTNPYLQDDSSEKALHIIKEFIFNENITYQKDFFDHEFTF